MLDVAAPGHITAQLDCGLHLQMEAPPCGQAYPRRDGTALGEVVAVPYGAPSSMVLWGVERLVGEEVDQHWCGGVWGDVVGLAGEGAALAMREGVREDSCGVVQHGHAVLAVEDEGGRGDRCD